jgi:hypothetical protein
MRDSIEHGMVAARLTTTSSDVAAFATLHLGDRAEKRRSAIDDALAIAAERMRVEQRLEARGRATLALSTDSATSLPPSSVPFLGQPRDSMTLADTPEALIPPIELIAKLTPRLSDAPQPSSYATLGLAAVDASAPLPPTPKSRKGPLAIVGLLLVAVAVAAAARLDVLRPESAPSHASSPPAVIAARPPPIVVPSASPAPTAVPTSTATSWSLLPTVNASALPKATGTSTATAVPDPVARPRPQRWVAPRKTPAAQEPEPEAPAEPAAPAPEPPPAPAPAPPSKSGPVDDGF